MALPDEDDEDDDAEDDDAEDDGRLMEGARGEPRTDVLKIDADDDEEEEPMAEGDAAGEEALADAEAASALTLMGEANEAGPGEVGDGPPLVLLVDNEGEDAEEAAPGNERCNIVVGEPRGGVGAKRPPLLLALAFALAKSRGASSIFGNPRPAVGPTELRPVMVPL